MKFLPVRFAVWLLTLALFPVSVTTWPYSFRVEVLERITSRTVGLGQEERKLDLAEHVLAYLENAENKEIDPWLRDDLRIAWITARWSQHGIPSWSLHGYATPHIAATFQVLHCHPDQVWPRILQQREAKLGALHGKVWGMASSPRKPVQSAKWNAARKDFGGVSQG